MSATVLIVGGSMTTVVTLRIGLPVGETTETRAVAEVVRTARLGAGIMGTSVTGATAPFGAEMMAGHFGVATTTGLATGVVATTTGLVIVAGVTATKTRFHLLGCKYLLESTEFQ